MKYKAIVDKDDKILYYVIKHEDSPINDFIMDYAQDYEFDKLTKEEFIFDLKNNNL